MHVHWVFDVFKFESVRHVVMGSDDVRDATTVISITALNSDTVPHSDFGAFHFFCG